jgi:hypothetical protein
MQPTDADLARLCAAIYGRAPVVEWDHFDQGDDDGVCWAVKSLPGFDVVVFRGSAIFEDWIRDFRAAPVRTRVGHVHAGFYAGLEHVLGDLRPILSQPAILTGHSLGAARASIVTALLVADGIAPASRIVFGEPKPGFADFGAIVAGVAGRSYRNGDELHHDLVTDVPFTVPPFAYTRPTPIIPVRAEPPPDDRWGAFSYHHIELYEAAVLAALSSQHTASK